MENTRKYRYIRGIASLLFGCAICLFWGLYYPHHLHYHEQFQLFLFTPEYGIDKCLHPGGIAEYIAEFLTQFYYFAWAGATILAIVLVLIQRQINWLAKQMGGLPTFGIRSAFSLPSCSGYFYVMRMPCWHSPSP